MDIQEKIRVLDETGFVKRMAKICEKMEISPLALIAIIEKEMSLFQMISVVLNDRSRGIVQESEMEPLMNLLFDITEKKAQFFHMLYTRKEEVEK